MAEVKQIGGFTPAGVVYKSTELPEPTDKTHKDLGLSKQQLLDMYQLMYLQRRFEERSAQMYQKGKFGGFLHLYMGQEAISTAAANVLNDDDDIITAYRDHGIGLARGISAKAGMSELFGKGTGCSHGKGGSMHFFDVENHFWGGHAIVGAHIPLGTGIAFANKYRNENKITMTLFGDGAVDQGSFHESLNLANLWKLPVIYVVENNGYSMGTAVNRHTATDIFKRARAYDMKSDEVNGMDLFTMVEKLREVADYVRENSEPYLLEARTYRYRGHSMSDPATYRTKEELEEFHSIDPIERLKDYLTSHHVASKKEIQEITDNVEQEVLDAIDFADDSDFPDPEDLFKHVYAEETDYNFIH